MGRALFALGTCLAIGACTSFTGTSNDTESPEAGAPVTDAGADASAERGPSDAGLPSDDAGTGDSGGEAHRDSGVPGCGNDDVIAGTLAIGTKERDVVAGEILAFPYGNGPSAITPTCARLYITNASLLIGVAIHFGVYDSTGPGNAPGNLLYEAVFDSPITGWNYARLSGTIALTSNQAVWLAVTPNGPSATLTLAEAPAPCAPAVKAMSIEENSMGSLPSPFGPTPTPQPADCTGSLSIAP